MNSPAFLHTIHFDRRAGSLRYDSTRELNSSLPTLKQTPYPLHQGLASCDERKDFAARSEYLSNLSTRSSENRFPKSGFCVGFELITRKILG